jgi:hypothetical protein
MGGTWPDQGTGARELGVREQFHASEFQNFTNYKSFQVAYKNHPEEIIYVYLSNAATGLGQPLSREVTSTQVPITTPEPRVSSID